MRYNLNGLGSGNFEHLIQSLSKVLFGNGAVTFGAGTDGGREATFEGEAPYPSLTNQWNGYWVIQAKFKEVNTPDEEKDFSWLKSEMTKDLNKYSTRQTKVKQPDNYILFTNVILTATAVTGGRDKANILEKEFEKKYKIKNVKIVSSEDIQDFLDNNRDIATSYAPFILPGDILDKLLESLNLQKERTVRVKEILCRFIEKEFKEDSESKLDHAGKLTDDKVNLEKVFIDLSATEDGVTDDKKQKFISTIIEKGNIILKGGSKVTNQFVLEAGPGYGKSTLTQFLAQAYRAYFLQYHDNCLSTNPNVDSFIVDFKKLILLKPKWVRLPIRIVLKEYAGWQKDEIVKNGNANISILEYIKFNINKKSGTGDISIEEVEGILKMFPCLFVFDGLDEVPVSSNREKVLEEINFFTDTILRRIDADSIIIATTRPQGYSKEFDQTRYKHLFITDLSPIDCKAYLNKLLDKLVLNSTDRENKLRILNDVLEHKDISRLMKSPLQASIMAILVISGGNPPRNKYDLFTTYYNIIFTREKQRNISPILSDKPEYIQKIHNKLGFFLQVDSEKSTNPAATIQIAQFEKLIFNFLSGIGVEKDEIKDITDKIINVAAHRLVFISEVEDQKIGFAIRSLQEYFAANGYIHSIKDDEIKPRILAISKNAYWSNTLLFCIGYISKNKDYLVDSIESICYELNGSINDDETQNLSSIVQSGSWLALDILNEGIFSDNPNMENKFGNLLKPLFSISTMKEHEKLVKLPEKLIKKWVIVPLGDTLDNINNSSWYICVLLYQNRYLSQEDINQYWPKDNLTKNYVTKLFIDNGVRDPLFINKLAIQIQENSITEFWHLFESENSNKILELLCFESRDNRNLKSILLEIIFVKLISFSNNRKLDYSKLLGILGLVIPSDREVQNSFFENDKESIRVNMIDGYDYDIKRIKPKVNGVFECIYKASLTNDIKLIKLTYELLSDINLETVVAFTDYLKSLDSTYSGIILANIKWSNSILSEILSDDFELSDSTLSDVVNKYERVNEAESELTAAEKINFIMHTGGWTFSLSGNYLKKLETFQSIYLSSEEMNSNYIEYYNFFNILFYHLTQEELGSLRNSVSLRQVFLDSLKAYLSQHKSITDVDLVGLFYLFNVKEIIEVCSDYPQFNQYGVKFYSNGGYGRDGDLNVLKHIVSNAANVIRLQCLLGSQPVYNILFQKIVNLGKNYGKLENDIIPFREILFDAADATVGSEYKAALILLDKEYSEVHFEKFVKIINEHTDVILNYHFFKSLLFALKFSPNNIYIDKTLLFINQKMQKNNSELTKEFQNFVKQYIGNKPTNLEVESLG